MAGAVGGVAEGWNGDAGPGLRRGCCGGGGRVHDAAVREGIVPARGAVLGNAWLVAWAHLGPVPGTCLCLDLVFVSVSGVFIRSWISSVAS